MDTKAILIEHVLRDGINWRIRLYSHSCIVESVPKLEQRSKFGVCPQLEILRVLPPFTKYCKLKSDDDAAPFSTVIPRFKKEMPRWITASFF